MFSAIVSKYDQHEVSHRSPRRRNNVGDMRAAGVEFPFVSGNHRRSVSSRGYPFN